MGDRPMPRATCRCGQALNVPDDGTARTVCPQCGARVKIRRPAGSYADGYLRFNCPCGRRLKVDAANPPSHGKCPDCGRVVPVPPASQSLPVGHPETPTEELSNEDLAVLDRWTRGHLAPASAAVAPRASVEEPPP